MTNNADSNVSLVSHVQYDPAGSAHGNDKHVLHVVEIKQPILRLGSTGSKNGDLA